MEDKIHILLILFVCVTVANAGVYCSKYSTYGRLDDSIYCSTSCCGDKYNRYCCFSNNNVGVIIGIVFGVIGLVAAVVTVLVIIFCCCRTSRGQTGQVFQPAGVTTTVPVYGVQTTTVAGYGQAGYTNTAFPQQIQTTYVPGPVADAKNWQTPPPPYNAQTATTS